MMGADKEDRRWQEEKITQTYTAHPSPPGKKGPGHYSPPSHVFSALRFSFQHSLPYPPRLRRIGLTLIMLKVNKKESQKVEMFLLWRRVES